MGRPTLLDDLRAKRIVDAVAAGASRSAAAEAANVGRSTLMSWLARGREGEPGYADFLDRIKTAEAKAENEMVAAIRIAGLNPRTWQAAAWWLERCRPKRYATKRDRVEAPAHPAGVAAGSDDVELLEGLLEAAKSRVG